MVGCLISGMTSFYRNYGDPSQQPISISMECQPKVLNVFEINGRVDFVLRVGELDI